MLPQLITGEEITFLMKFETIFKSCIRIVTGNNIVLTTSISVLPENDI